MIDPQNVPDVDASETLTRFILSKRHIRNSDETIKPDAFVPHPHRELSVTRHRDASNDELWHTGVAIATHQQRTLRGRGDVAATAFIRCDLSVQADPIREHPILPDNPNHANVIGWPADSRDRQRLLALKIAAEACLVRPPHE